MADARVLVIDDEKSVHASVASRLEGVVDEILGAHSPSEGIRMAMQESPDVILLDINMPDMDGYKVCRHLKEHAGTRDVPILFLTVDRNVEHLARALDCGGSDYILKPFNAVELEARVRAALRTKRMFDLLREQARIDALTGLSNRAAMDDALLAAAAAHERTGQPLALLMIDIDHFKQINDRYGHGVGDAVLREVGAVFRSRCRPYDVACRFGGDEFAIILGQTEGEDARSAARRLLSGIDDLEIRATSDIVTASTSAGLVSTAEMNGTFTPGELVKEADSALYRAKREGRRRLVVAEDCEG